MAAAARALCPSADPQSEGAAVFAVIGGTSQQAHASYLTLKLPWTDVLHALVGPANPAEVFRAAAPCAAGACVHYDGSAQACRLARKTVQWAPVVVERLPRCAIRAGCQWWQQEGAAACRRCPQVVTLNPSASAAMRRAADPQAV